MRRLRLRLLAVALALVGLVMLAGLEQQELRRQADHRIAEAVAGYLTLAVPASPFGDYAADRLISTVSRLQGSAYWHAGLQVTLMGTPVFDDVTVPAEASVVPLPGPGGVDTLGQVAVWGAALRGGLPGASWIFAAATFLVAGLANSRRASWLWPVLGIALLLLAVRALLAETRRTARTAAEMTLVHVGPMAALLLLDARRSGADLAVLGPTVVATELPDSATAAPPQWRDGPEGGVAAVAVTRGSGQVIELATAAPPIDGQLLTLGVVGGGIVLLLAMLPPILPRRRRRPPGRADGGNIPA